MASLLYGGTLTSTSTFTDHLILGEKEVLQSNAAAHWLSQATGQSLQAATDALAPLLSSGDATTSLTFYHHQTEGASGNPFLRVTVATIAAERSRNMGAIRSDLIAETTGKWLPKEGSVLVTLVLAEESQAYAAAVSIARVLPLFNKKTLSAKANKPKGPLTVRVVVRAASDTPATASESWSAAIDYKKLQLAADGIRQCCRLVDMPASELYTDSYVEEVKAMVAQFPSSANVKMTVIRGKELKEKGFGGLWGVGKAAVYPPALVVLSYSPPKATKSVAMVGKGIVYDTGGLSIKVGGSMCTMKTDMGGSAAILCAFHALVMGSHDQTVHALLCLAENSVDAESTRNDDILYMYSGKTVEINNTDAEGRLVLADGVAYASRHLQPDVLIDMATLTGAQMVTTGQKHAAILSNDEWLERKSVEAGKKSGDWVFPILYAPELLKSEFKSEVADMKNSVKNRYSMNGVVSQVPM